MKTVNFLEAIKSGKRFRPIDNERHNWWFFDEHGQLKRYLIEDDAVKNLELHRCDYDGEFELEEKTITITESDFDDAIGVADAHNRISYEFEKILKRELGF